MEYDNSGLTLGDRDSVVNGIYITLDVDLEAITDAKKNNCNFILSHHPLIFNPIKNLDMSGYQAKLIALAIKENIIIYSAHTSVDNAEYSIAYQNLVDIGATDIKRIGELYVAEIPKITVEDLAKRLEKTTLEDSLKYTFKNKSVTKVGHINGSGGRMSEIIPTLANQKVDVFISSEFKYSFLKELYNNSIAVIELNHYNSERAFLVIMKNVLNREFCNVVINGNTENPYQKE